MKDVLYNTIYNKDFHESFGMCTTCISLSDMISPQYKLHAQLFLLKAHSESKGSTVLKFCTFTI